MPAKTRFDPVQIAHAGGLTGGLEGAAATGGGAVLLWGWFFDPASELGGLRCEIAGRTHAVELLDRLPRPDIVETFASAVRSRTPEVGFLGLTQADPDLLRSAGGRITLTFDAAGGSAASANRLVFEPGSPLDATVGGRLPVRLMRPEAIRRAGEAIWAPEAARVLDQARRNARMQSFGPQSSSRLSLVIPVGDNSGALRETLAYLDMDPERAALEVVLVLRREEDWTGAEQAVVDASTDLRIVVAATGEALSTGVAARIGVEAASSDHLVLMSDAVVPPTGGWISGALEDLAGGGYALPEALPRFDGLPQRFEPRAIRGPTAWPHEDVRLELQAAAGRVGLERWSPGLVAARRDALDQGRAPWSGPVTDEGFWAFLAAEAARAAPAPLRAGSLFTYAPVASEAELSADEQLLDTYLLASRLQREATAGFHPAAAA